MLETKFFWYRCAGKIPNRTLNFNAMNTELAKSKIDHLFCCFCSEAPSSVILANPIANHRFPVFSNYIKDLQETLEMINKIEGVERTLTSLIIEEHFNKGAVIL